MDFTTLPTTLGEFVDSIVPALSQVLFLLIVLALLVGFKPLLNLLERNWSERLESLTSLAKNRFIKESGLLKLIPVGVFIGFLLFATALDRFVLAVGDVIPGKIAYTQPDLLMASVPEGEIGRLWSLYPAAADAFTLNQVLENEISRAEASNPKERLPWQSHDERVGRAEREIECVKFYALFGVICLLLHRRFAISAKSMLARYLVLLAVGCAVIAYAVSHERFELAQSQWSRVDYVLATKIAVGGDALEARMSNPDVKTKYESQVTEFKNSHAGTPTHVRW